jgi:hypothetical protein
LRIKLDSKKLVAFIFIFFIALGGILTLILSPKQVLGGFARGYINSPDDCDVFQKVGNSLKEFDGRTSEYFAFHDISINTYGGIQKLVNRSLIDDTDKSSQVLKLNNGYLTFKENGNTDLSSLQQYLGQFTRNYTQTVKRAADNKRRYAPGWVHSTCLLRGFPKGAAPHLAHDFAEQSVVCYTLCRRCPENTVAAGEGKGI